MAVIIIMPFITTVQSRLFSRMRKDAHECLQSNEGRPVLNHQVSKKN
jgi:hypothetical protein